MIPRLLFAAGLNRRSVRAQRRAGDAARDARDWPGAIAGYRAYLAAQPQAWPIWVQLGHAYKEAGALGAAEAAYRRAAEAAPQDADVQLQLGRVLRMLGRVDEATAALERSAGLRPGGDAAAELATLRESKADPILSEHRDSGDKARDAGQWAAAARHYRDHLEDNPEDAPIWVQLGNMLKDAGEYREAQAAYRRAIEIDGDAADTFLQLGHVLKLSGARDEAIRAYRTSQTLDPDGGATTELLALELSGALDADAQADAALVNGDTKPAARMLLWATLLDAHAARDRGNWAVAAALYRTYLATQRESGAVWMDLAFALGKQHDYHEALHALDNAMRLGSVDSGLAERRIALLSHVGRPTEAGYALRALLLQGDRKPAASGQDAIRAPRVSPQTAR